MEVWAAHHRLAVADAERTLPTEFWTHHSTAQHRLYTQGLLRSLHACAHTGDEGVFLNPGGMFVPSRNRWQPYWP